MARIAIIGGCGSSGRLLGASYINAGHEVVFVDSDREAVHEVTTLAETNTFTVNFKEKGDETEASYNVSISPDNVLFYNSKSGKNTPPKNIGLVICTIPAYAKTQKAGEYIASIAKQTDAVVLDVGNGFREKEPSDFERVIGTKLVRGVINHPAVRNENGVTNLTSADNLTRNGLEVGKENISLVKEIEERALNANLNIKHDCPEHNVIMKKLAGCIAIAILAILGTTFADAAKESEPTGDITKALVDELGIIAKATGIENFPTYENMLATFNRKGTGKGSMANALNSGKKNRT